VGYAVEAHPLAFQNVPRIQGRKGFDHVFFLVVSQASVL
jgi:hypothetical protein